MGPTSSPFFTIISRSWSSSRLPMSTVISMESSRSDLAVFLGEELELFLELELSLELELILGLPAFFLGVVTSSSELNSPPSKGATCVSKA